MRPFISAYFKISGLCVLISLTLQSWVLRLLYDAGMKALLPSFVVAILGGTGVYFILYKFTSWAYERWRWRRCHKSLNIDGTWYHVIESEERPDYKRYGRTQIRQELFSIQIRGMNYDRQFHRNTRSLWHSAAASLDENGLLIFTYQVSRAGSQQPKEKMGLMQVQIYGERRQPPERLEGIFQDAHPSDLRGSITWERKVPWAEMLPCEARLEPATSERASLEPNGRGHNSEE
jgi:hypothetical protein